MKKILFILFFCAPFTGTFAQDQKVIDSLIGTLPFVKDSVKVSVYIKISQYYQSRETEKSLMYCQLALELAKKIRNRSLIGSTYYRYGNIYNGKGDYTQAFDMLIKGYALFDSIHYYRGMANCANSIGNIFLARKDTTNMFKYYNMALENAEHSNDPAIVAVVKVGLGNVYQTQKRHAKAIAYFTDAAAIFKSKGQNMEYSICEVNIGSSYLEMGDFEKADKILTIIIPIAEEIGNKYVLALTLAQEGQAKKGLKKYGEAIALFYRALSVAKEIKARDNISEMYNYLGSAYAAIGKSDSAYMYVRLFSDLRDSIFNEETAKQTAEMETKYETAKKDKEIIQTNAESEKNRIAAEKHAAERNTFIIGFALMLVLAIFVYRGYYQKKKDAVEITRQKIIIEEKNKDITDSIRYAQNIQSAILPHDDLIYEHLKESFILFQPKDLVSGDFYWLHPHKEQVLIGAIDCTGHGVPGALMSIVGHNALKQVVTVASRDLSPAFILDELNVHLRELFSTKYSLLNINDGMDAAICMIDRKQMKIRFAGAHNPMYRVSEGVLHEIKGDKQSVSGQSDVQPRPFTDHEISISKKDCIYIFSDGFADQFGGPSGKKFKTSKLKELILSVSSKPMHEQKNLLDAALNEWKGDLEQIDDVLVIGFRI